VNGIIKTNKYRASGGQPALCLLQGCLGEINSTVWSTAQKKCGRIIRAIETHNAKGVLTALYVWLQAASFNVTANKLIYPIPYREIQINSKLTQTRDIKVF
jgi:hypothetical protein